MCLLIFFMRKMLNRVNFPRTMGVRRREQKRHLFLLKSKNYTNCNNKNNCIYSYILDQWPDLCALKFYHKFTDATLDRVTIP